MSETLKNLGKIYQLAKDRLSSMTIIDDIDENTDIDKVKKIFRDLKLHEIELEMQNWELLRASNEIERINHYYLNFYENAPVSLVKMNKKGYILSSNTTFSNLLKMEKKDIHRKNIYSLFNDTAESDKLHIYINNLLSTEKNQVFELFLGENGPTADKNLVTASIEINKDTNENEINLCLMSY